MTPFSPLARVGAFGQLVGKWSPRLSEIGVCPLLLRGGAGGILSRLKQNNWGLRRLRKQVQHYPKRVLPCHPATIT